VETRQGPLAEGLGGNRGSGEGGGGRALDDRGIDGNSVAARAARRRRPGWAAKSAGAIGSDLKAGLVSSDELFEEGFALGDVSVGLGLGGEEVVDRSQDWESCQPLGARLPRATAGGGGVEHRGRGRPGV